MESWNISQFGAERIHNIDNMIVLPSDSFELIGRDTFQAIWNFRELHFGVFRTCAFIDAMSDHEHDGRQQDYSCKNYIKGYCHINVHIIDKTSKYCHDNGYQNRQF